MNLYELSVNFAQLQDLVENEEVDIDALADTLESIEGGIEDKFENISKLIKNLEGKIDMFKKEESRIKTRRTSMDNKVKWLKNYMLTSLELTKKTKVEAGTFSVRKQKNPQSIIITNKSKLPKEFLIPQEPKEDNKAIKEALKSGKKVEGAVVAPESYHIRIQ